MVRSFFYFLFIFFFYEICSADQNNLRGVWIVRGDISNQTELDNLTRLSKKLKLTDWYLQVYALGERQDLDMDLTERIIKTAHQERVRVHAWMNVFFIWQGEGQPENETHPFFSAGEYLFDLSYLKKNSAYKALRSNGEEGYFIDPASELYLNYFLEMTRLLLSRYNFDGLHLDYFRYPSSESAISINNSTQFQQNHFLSPAQFTHLSASGKFHTNLIESLKEGFNSQKKEKLDLRIRAIRDFLRDQFPGLLLSAAVKANLEEAGNRYSQNWQSWLENDYCDYVIAMNYTPIRNDYLRNNRMILGMINPARVNIGLATYNQSIEEVKYRLENLNPQFSGWVLFSSKVLTKNSKMTDGISQILKN